MSNYLARLASSLWALLFILSFFSTLVARLCWDRDGFVCSGGFFHFLLRFSSSFKRLLVAVSLSFFSLF